MKKEILKELDAMGIRKGDEISEYDCSIIRRAIAGDTPEKISRFYRAWYAVTDDRAGCGSWPTNSRRTK